MHAITAGTEDAKRFFIILAFEDMKLLIQISQLSNVLASLLVAMT